MTFYKNLATNKIYKVQAGDITVDLGCGWFPTQVTELELKDTKKYLLMDL